MNNLAIRHLGSGFVRGPDEIDPEASGSSLFSPETVTPDRPTAIIHQFALRQELTICRDPEPRIYRDVVCDLCEKTVSLALDVPLAALQARTRQNQDVALARQIAMYLCNTMFSVMFAEIGLHFGRDRTTVSHACKLVEDKRDELSFDVMLCQLEALLGDARDAVYCAYAFSGEEGEKND